ncbi:MAG: CMP-binding protein [delta proteobacterium ML8_F1]|nr:MAG: CMP-binding protein [delta proteobacterium ML8_F1]
MENIFIKEFEAGKRIIGYYIIKSYNLKTSSNNKKYLDLTLMDKTGEVNGKIWGIDDEAVKDYKSGMVIKVEGDVTLWNNTLQLKIIRYRPVNEEDEINIEDFVPAAPIETESMYQQVMTFKEMIQDEEIRTLVGEIYEEYRGKLLYYPAAKMHHHAIYGGLLYHVLRMLMTGEKLCEVYPVNKDLLFAGIMLHDIEKINEMDADDMGIVGEYTRDGQLLGHIIQGIVKIDHVGKAIAMEDEKIKLIQHMILSHHYEPEYGSPKKPMIPEAELLHYIDMIDARMYDMDKVLGTQAPGEFSEPVFVLDKRRLYKATF